MRICSRCKITKEDFEFSFKNKPLGKLASECKSCHKELRRAYYINNSDKEKTRTRHVKLLRWDWFKELKSTLICSICNETHVATLHFHHTDQSKKEFTISTAVRTGFGKQRLLDEISKCKILCANCHAKLHWEEKQKQFTDSE